ncbi:MAG: hypothetical protein KKH94_11220 [Candidatus Omnitrophica bacterium]|nr:hypothetical protein [Candidatus Omnitrophota bacterium]
MKNVQWKAVIVGFCVDIIGSILAISAIMGVMVFVLVKQYGMDISQPQLIDIITKVSTYRIIGLIFTVAGGFVAAQIAKRSELQHGLLVGIVHVTLAVPITLLIIFMNRTIPSSIHLVQLFLIIPCAILGGYLRYVLIGAKDTK